MNSAVDDPIAPPAAKTIAGPGASTNTFTGATGITYPGEDALTNTVTIRNINLNPYPAGPPSTDQSAANQAWNTHVQPVTFWCSDGNLATSATVLFWTDNHYNLSLPIGVQRLSGISGPWVRKKTDNFQAADPKWKMFDFFFDRLTSHTLNGVGICFNVTEAGNSWGSVQSPMPYFTLEQNMVYKLRCTMNSSSAAVGNTPFWDFILENWNGDATVGMNLYGMDSFYLDNEGGANTILQTTAGTEVQMYWCPSAFQTPQWNNASTGLFSIDTSVVPNVPRYGAVKDPCLRFRVLDLDANAALRNNEKSGDICLTKCIVEAAPYSRMVVEAGGANIVNIGGIHTDGLAYAPQNASNTVPGGNMIVANLTGSTAAYTAPVNSGTTHTPGYVTITPAGATAPTAEMVEITPATERNYTFPSNDILDNWPIPWQSNKLYQLVVELSAPAAIDAAHPYDVIYLSMEPPTNEIITETWVTATKGIATPKTGAKQQYMMFYNGGKETVSAVANLHFLRWRVRFANSQNLHWPNPSDVNNNNGKVILHTVTVNTVKFQ
jgi:hypothetical protein